MLSPFELKSFESSVRYRARATLGLRGYPNAEHCLLCISAIDHALTRGSLTEVDIVNTARQVASDTQRWR